MLEAMNTVSHIAFRPALFLDRDGVINHDRLDFVKSWKEFRFSAGVLKTLRILAGTPYAIVIVTNQSGIGRGIMSEGAVKEIHKNMLHRVRRNGGRIDALLYCPHAPEDQCTCRKPSPEMLFRAANDLNLDLSKSFMIGDRWSDIEAGKRAGCKTILLNHHPAKGKVDSAPDYVAESWSQILAYVLPEYRRVDQAWVADVK